MTVLNCPYCDVRSTVSWRTQITGKSQVFEILQCDNCNELILRITEGKYVRHYPARIPKLDTSIPEQVANDYVEAIKCFDVGANKAAVVMCRRALQNSVLEKGAKKEKLFDQIDELHTNQVITKDIKDWAHEIRITGNIGAHPDQDGLEDVTKEDAEELIRFMEEYLNYVYTMPSVLAKKRTARTTSSKTNL